MSFGGVLQSNGLEATIERSNRGTRGDDQPAPESRRFEFQPFDSLPPVTKRGRHLAACYEQFLKIQRYTAEPADPIQPDSFLQATANLAEWIEMDADRPPANHPQAGHP